MSRQVRVSDETYERLQALADGRPLGMVIERALDQMERRPAAGTRGEPGALRLADTVGHDFRPQKGNALRCEVCGHRRADHQWGEQPPKLER